MMKKIKLYIAASIDGYIAESDGGLDWLSKYPITDEFNYGYKEFYESIDTVIMGGRTYRDITLMDVIWPYKDKNTYVVSRSQLMKKDTISFISDNVIETISQLREKDGKDIWLVGGGELIAMLLQEKLIDEMIITYIPVLLGNGIRLFPENKKESTWRLVEQNAYENNVLKVTYCKVE